MPRYVPHLLYIVNISELTTDLVIPTILFAFPSDTDGGCCFVRPIEHVEASTSILTSPSFFFASDYSMLLLVTLFLFTFFLSVIINFTD